MSWWTSTEMRSKTILVPLTIRAILALTAPRGGYHSGDDAGGDSGGSDLIVLAASSVTESFDELEKSFEAEHDVDVKISYDSSSVLAEQVIQGAPADVLATADEQTMQQVVDADLTEKDPQSFAQNFLAIVTPPDYLAGITHMRDCESDSV